MAEELLSNEVMDLEEEEKNTQSDKYLCFKIGDENYGMDIRYVLEIIEMQKITPIPDLPPALKGVINLRGSVIPVMDLRLRFGMPEREHDDRTCVVIVEIDTTCVGLIVDTVAEVLDIAKQQIDDPPDFKNVDDHQKFINGLAKMNSGVKILLNAHALIFDEEKLKILQTSQT